MGLFIKNPEVERKVREVAQRRGVSITTAIGDAFDRELALDEAAARKRPRPTLEELRAATNEFRRKAGLDKVKLNVTKADFDALWEIPGFDPEDDRS